VNLGSPESPDQKDVKPYLDEFLMEKKETVIMLTTGQAFIIKQ